MNSGSLKISTLTRVYNLCIYFKFFFWFWLKCLTLLKSCWRGNIRYTLVRIVVHLKLCGERLVLVVQIILRVFPQRYRDCLEKKSA